MDEDEKEFIKEIVKQIPIKDVYEDLAKTTVSESGELIGLVPSVLNALFDPVHTWAMQINHSRAMMRKLMAVKLKNFEPHMIVQPEPHIAIPTLLASSYCDDEELRDMYATLLANSMHSMMKENAHPGYVEIIKQLTPDEARLFKRLPPKGLCEPIIDLMETRPGKEGVFVYYSNASVLGVEANCDFPDNTPIYINNLCRLGIAEIRNIPLYDEWRYDKILKSESYARIREGIPKGHKVSETEKMFGITDFGVSFRKVCIE